MGKRPRKINNKRQKENTQKRVQKITTQIARVKFNQKPIIKNYRDKKQYYAQGDIRKYIKTNAVIPNQG
jgi:hypothetical protein